MKRRCPQCERFLGPSHFYWTAANSKCKDCVCANVRANRRKKLEYYREYDRKRAMSPGRVKARKEYLLTDRGKEAHNKATKRWMERNLIKRAAHLVVSTAIASGRLVRGRCEKCSKLGQAHHDDYAKPLEVRWLCSKHHRQLHEKGI
jgi:hypothetical protein